MVKPQIIYIHGGESHDSEDEFLDTLKKLEYDPYEEKVKKWRDWVNENLENEMLIPQMPNKQYAFYSAWKIWFEKVVQYLNGDCILIGHSLGGIFLTKYLSENEFPKSILQLHLVSAPFDESGLEGEKLRDFKLSSDKLSKINLRVEKIFMYHSKDDFIVPFTHLEKYCEYLDCEKIIFENRGHILQEEFPELLERIGKLN